MTARARVAVALVVAATFVGCEAAKRPPRAGQPPVEFSFRKSQVPMRGMVVGIRNASASETLTNLVVKVSSPKEQGTRSHRVNVPVEPQDTITVGWVELDGWKLKPDDHLSVTCEQYTGAATAEVPDL